MTVSMALRNHPRVSEKVRQEIIELAESLGYRPDPMLSALATYSQKKSQSSIQSSIAWLNAWTEPEKLREFKEFDFYWKGAYAAAEKYGYRLEEFRMNKEFTAKRLHQIFRTRGIRGILLPPHGYVNPPWEDFPWEEYSVARFGRSLAFPVTHLVSADQAANTIVAYQSIIARGYHRIGFVTDESDLQPRGHHFAAGYLSIRETLDEAQRIPILKFCSGSTADHGRLLREWMDRHRPDAILTPHSGLDKLLTKVGYRVPHDVGLAVTTILDCGVDSGIDQHPEEVGRVAFLMLNSLINDGARGIPKIFRQVLVEGSWVDGTSLPSRLTAPTAQKARK